MPAAKELLGRAAKRIAYRAGYSLTVRYPGLTDPYGPSVTRIFGTVQPFTMTPLNCVAGMISAVDYVEAAGIPGAILECGVWRGGSMMAAALRLRDLNAVRHLYLFDTFEGMTKPTEHDVNINGFSKLDEWERDPEAGRGAAVSLDTVRANMRRTGYPDEHVTYIKGPVEQTLPGPLPDRLAILRLDTDWYESTRHELETCWDRLAPGGVLIIDDYGYFEGARKATDEFFAGSPVMLTPLNHAARLIVKR